MRKSITLSTSALWCRVICRTEGALTGYAMSRGVGSCFRTIATLAVLLALGACTATYKKVPTGGTEWSGVSASQ
jgi:hypothetical protein